MKPLVISFSGGRTSGYMAKMLVEKYRNKREILVVFANTGKEREETLDFVHQCDIEFGLNVHWIESVQNHNQRKTPSYRVVTYKTACRNGDVFEDFIKKHGLPNAAFPSCTRELKTAPINNYIRSKIGNDYDLAIGIRIDEPKRIKNKLGIIYPLVNEFPTTKLMVNKWWYNQKFNLDLKDYEGNCDMCWKKSKRKLLTLLIENPGMINWWNEMEIKYGSYIPPTQTAKRQLPITFFRDNTSAIELIEDSNEPFKLQKDAFSVEELIFFQPELDFESVCGSSSCEPF